MMALAFPETVTNEVVEQIWRGDPTIRFLADVGDDIFHFLASMTRSDVC